MTQILELSDKVFKITIINVLKVVMKMWTMCKIKWVIIAERGEL